MNKSQELEVMVMRAEIAADEAVKQHFMAWYGEDIEVVEEEVDDGDN